MGRFADRGCHRPPSLLPPATAVGNRRPAGVWGSRSGKRRVRDQEEEQEPEEEAGPGEDSPLPARAAAAAAACGTSTKWRPPPAPQRLFPALTAGTPPARGSPNQRPPPSPRSPAAHAQCWRRVRPLPPPPAGSVRETATFPREKPAFQVKKFIFRGQNEGEKGFPSLCPERSRPGRRWRWSEPQIRAV